MILPLMLCLYLLILICSYFHILETVGRNAHSASARNLEFDVVLVLLVLFTDFMGSESIEI